MLRLLIFIVVMAVAMQVDLAYAHFFGATKNIDKYQIVFSPYPSAPVAGRNSTLNFSILEDNTNIYNIFAAVTISDKQSGKIIDQVPYKLYEFSDITVPYLFKDTGDYIVTLQTRIAGDQKYEINPLIASFDIPVGNQFIPFDELMLFYVTPTAVAIAGIAIYLHSRKKI